MAPVHNHSPHKRTRIVTAYKCGRTARRIGADEGISDRAVYSIVERYAHQRSAKDRPRSGRPRVLGIRDKRHIFRIIGINPFIQSRELLEKAGLCCSISTLNRYLKKEGIQHQKALRRPKLTPEIAAQRLAFANEYINIRYWRLKRWIFTDEVTVVRGQGERQKWVFCRRGERLYFKNVQPREKSSRHSQMFWGGIKGLRRSPLAPLYGDPEAPRGGVTGRRIQACLEENLPTIVNLVIPSSKITLLYTLHMWSKIGCVSGLEGTGLISSISLLTALILTP